MKHISFLVASYTGSQSTVSVTGRDAADFVLLCKCEKYENSDASE
jgi:hypothetical protein